MNNIFLFREVFSRFSSGKSISASKIHDKGKYPVFGGNGLRGYTDSFNFEGECAIIGRQGAYCGNVRYFSGKAYMTEHAIVACGKEKHNTRFLAYKLGLMGLGRYAGQSAQPGLSVETLLDVSIDLPEKEKQDKIANFLSKIDSKITNNTSMCSDLESMAKLIYDYWFVQFDFPDENGRPYKSSGGKMVWNEKLKREIPEGWSCKKVDDIAVLYQRSIIPEDETYYKHFSIPAYDEKHLPSLEKGSFIESNKYQVLPNTILVSKLNPQFKRLWYIPKVAFDSICSTEFMPYQSKTGHSGFLFEVFNSDAFSKFLIQCSSSSTGSRKRMDPALSKEFLLAYPSEEKIIEEFDKVATNILSKIVTCREENQQLSSLRDFLLPMLMNGQVKVKS